MPNLIQKEHYKSVGQGWHRYLDMIDTLALEHGHGLFEFNYVKEKFATMRLQMTMKRVSGDGVFEQSINCLNMSTFREEGGIDEKLLKIQFTSFLNSILPLHQDFSKKNLVLEKLKDVFYLENISRNIADLASLNCENCENLGTSTNHKPSGGWIKCMCSNCSEVYKNLPIIPLPPINTSELNLYAAVNMQKLSLTTDKDTLSEYMINKKALSLIEETVLKVNEYEIKEEDQISTLWDSKIFKIISSFAYEYKNFLHAMKVCEKLKQQVQKSEKCSAIFISSAWSDSVDSSTGMDKFIKQHKLTLLEVIKSNPELLSLMPDYKSIKNIAQQVNEVVNNEAVKNVYSNATPSPQNTTQAQQVCDYLEILQTHKMLNSHVSPSGPSGLVKKI